jgi:hypothetical protein
MTSSATSRGRGERDRAVSTHTPPEVLRVPLVVAQGGAAAALDDQVRAAQGVGGVPIGDPLEAADGSARRCPARRCTRNGRPAKA